MKHGLQETAKAGGVALLGLVLFFILMVLFCIGCDLWERVMGTHRLWFWAAVFAPTTMVNNYNKRKERKLWM